MTARAFAGLAFVASLLFLVLAHRRLRDRARAEEADGLLHEAFERLEHPAPQGDRTPRSG
jgi:hypothetical protein